ncbi:MAG: hypothetical protein KH989_12545, partial [Kocuria rhizophila]|nr:hypothetical protein [Kocuria rhizophila]
MNSRDETTAPTTYDPRGAAAATGTGPTPPAFETVVVTGAGGGMGTAVVADLLARGYAVAALDLPEGDPWQGRRGPGEDIEALTMTAKATETGRLSYR